jgi:hypothetical protein
MPHQPLLFDILKHTPVKLKARWQSYYLRIDKVNELYQAFTNHPDLIGPNGLLATDTLRQLQFVQTSSFFDFSAPNQYYLDAGDTTDYFDMSSPEPHQDLSNYSIKAYDKSKNSPVAEDYEICLGRFFYSNYFAPFGHTAGKQLHPGDESVRALKKDPTGKSEYHFDFSKYTYFLERIDPRDYVLPSSIPWVAQLYQTIA